MSKVTQKCITLMAEELLAEQADFALGGAPLTDLQQLHLERNNLQHGKDLNHNFTDFKEVFDRVWHKRQMLQKFNIEKGLIRTTEVLFDGSMSSVLLNNEGESFSQ